MEHIAVVADRYRVDELHEHRSDQFVIANVGDPVVTDHLEHIVFVIVRDEVEEIVILSCGVQREDIRGARDALVEGNLQPLPPCVPGIRRASLLDDLDSAYDRLTVPGCQLGHALDANDRRSPT